jgi:hypothetical protein
VWLPHDTWEQFSFVTLFFSLSLLLFLRALNIDGSSYRPPARRPRSLQVFSWSDYFSHFFFPSRRLLLAAFNNSVNWSRNRLATLNYIPVFLSALERDKVFLADSPSFFWVNEEKAF